MSVTYSSKLNGGGGGGPGVVLSSKLVSTGGGDGGGTPPVTDAEPDWAMLVDPANGITLDGATETVTAIADQSTHGNNSAAVAGVTKPAAESLNGFPILQFAGGIGSYAQFSNIVAVDNRAELTTGMAIVMIQSTSDGNHGRGTICQGRYGGKIVVFFNRYQVYAELQNGRSGGGNLSLNGVGTDWEFKAISLHTTGDTSINMYAGNSFGGKFDDPFSDIDANTFDSQYPLLLGSRYEDNSPGTFPNAGTQMKVAAFGIVDPIKIAQARAYWSTKFNRKF